MKKLVLSLPLLFAAALSAQTPSAGTATKITVSWTAPTAPAGATITQYTASIASPAGDTIAIGPCAAAVTTNCIAPGAATTSFTYMPGGALYYGSWQISVVTNGTTASGPATPSTPASTTIVYAAAAITMPAPGGLTVQFN